MKTKSKKTIKKVKIVPFSKLSPQQKRIAIAKDVIEQIDADNFIAKTGVYFLFNDLDSIPHTQETQLQLLLPFGECECCAKGALFASCVVKNNHYTAQQYKEDSAGKNGNLDNGINKHLKGIFSTNQLDLIETAFEMYPVKQRNSTLCTSFNFGELSPYSYYGDFQDCYNSYFDYATPLCKSAMEFGSKWENDPKERLKQIMLNLIENKGTFKP